MPVVLREGPYSFHFYAGDRNEPIHIHVRRDDCIAKYWLNPVDFADNDGFSRNELRRIERSVTKNVQQLTDAWHEYFND